MSCLGATRRHRRHIMSSIGCIRCGYLGPSNDTIPRSEMLLAEFLADNVQLFEPGEERDDHDEAMIEIASEHPVRPPVSRRPPRAGRAGDASDPDGV